jgi:hypothetical protein
MKAIKLGLLAITATLAVTTSQAQNVDEVINKHLEAMGGKQKLGDIKSVYIESTIEVMGNEAPSTTTILNGKGYKSEIDFGGQKIVQCFTDTSGWGINPMAGQTTAEPMPKEQVDAAQDQLYIAGPLFDYAAKGNKVELAGKEKVGNVDAYKVNVTSKNNTQSTFYIDPSTYYVLKEIRKMNVPGQGDVEISMVFSNYQKTDYGNVMPYKTEMTLPGFTLTTTTKKVDVNKPVDENIFKKG